MMSGINGAVAAGISDRVAGDLRRRRVVSRLPYVRVLLLVRRGDVPCLLRRDDQYPYPDGQLGGHGPDERGAELPADFRRVGDSAARNRRRGHRFGHFGGRVARLFRRLHLSSCRVAGLRPVPVQGNRVEDSPAGVRGFGLDHVAGGDRLYQLVHLLRGDRKPGRAAARRYEYGAQHLVGGLPLHQRLRFDGQLAGRQPDRSWRGGSGMGAVPAYGAPLLRLRTAGIAALRAFAPRGAGCLYGQCGVDCRRAVALGHAHDDRAVRAGLHLSVQRFGHGQYAYGARNYAGLRHGLYALYAVARLCPPGRRGALLDGRPRLLSDLAGALLCLHPQRTVAEVEDLNFARRSLLCAARNEDYSFH